MTRVFPFPNSTEESIEASLTAHSITVVILGEVVCIKVEFKLSQIITPGIKWVMLECITVFFHLIKYIVLYPQITVEDIKVQVKSHAEIS